MRMSRRRVVRIAAIAGFGAVAAACVPITQPPPPAPPAPPPAGPVTRTTLVSGLDKPWDIAFMPGATGVGGSMIFTENDSGKVKAYINSSAPQRSSSTSPTSTAPEKVG